MKKKCEIGNCKNKARYIVGIGKIEVCIDCFDRLPDSEKSDLYHQKLVEKIRIPQVKRGKE